MSDKLGARKRASRAIKHFFIETFRTHSRAEYINFMSRGFSKNNSTGINKTYPWFYVRAFILFFALFVVNLLVLKVTDNPLYLPSVLFLGGIAVTVPFFVFLYELYPERDLSMTFLLGLLVIGGSLSSFLCQTIYTAIVADNGWLLAVEAGVTEEFFKALITILCIVLFKPKNAFGAFLIGAAVGSGFAISEDMGYLYSHQLWYSNYGFANRIQAIVGVFVDRGASTFVTHTLWTAAIGWAFARFKKPFLNFKFYGIALISVALHIIWDFPIKGVIQGLTICACSVAAVLLNVEIIYSSRRKVIDDDFETAGEQLEMPQKALPATVKVKNSAYFSQAGNLVISIFLFVACAGWLLFCWIAYPPQYRKIYLNSPKELVYYLQGGHKVVLGEEEWLREYDYDSSSNDYVHNYENGHSVYAEQTMPYFDKYGQEYTVYYGYSFDDFDGDGVWLPKLIDVSIDFEYRAHASKIDISGEIYSVFIVNPVRDYETMPIGIICVTTMEIVPMNKTVEYIPLIISSVIFASGVVVSGALKIKSRRMYYEEQRLPFLQDNSGGNSIV